MSQTTTRTDPSSTQHTRNPSPDADSEISHEKAKIQDSDREDSSDVHRPSSLPAVAPPASDPNLVTWDGPNDPENPQSWPVRRKWLLTAACAEMTLCV